MDSSQEISAWLSKFGDVLLRNDTSGVLKLFLEEECYWRDYLAFTWNLLTCESKNEIAQMLEETLQRTEAEHWEIDGTATESGGVVEAAIRFENPIARCRGYLRLREGKCWVIVTTLWQLKGHEEQAGPFRPPGVVCGAVKGRKTWLQIKKQEELELGHCKQPYCVIIGGGQAGIALGARLKALGVPTIIVEKNAKPGDTWRNRFSTLNTHTPLWADHFPYMNFPSTWPLFSSKDQMGDFLECYVKLIGLNYWCSSECKSANFDEKEGCWKVLLENKKDGSVITLRPVHLILATGSSGFANVPRFKGEESFQGVQVHSSKFHSGEGWEGKHCVIIGAGVSAHDICQDLWEQGASQVTMVQKSSTTVVGQLTILQPPPNEDEINASTSAVENFDMLMFSVPYKLLTRFQVPLYEQIAKADKNFYDRLTKAGFKLDFGEDGSGLYLKLLRRGGGYYLDVGASELIASGEIQVKSGVSVQEIRAKSVLFTDGSEVAADLIVYATGYKNMKEFIAKLISQEVSDKVGLIWGLGSDTQNDPGPWAGELRNLWKPLAHPNLWIMGGPFSQSRQMSRFLAIQLKTRMENIPTPVFWPDCHTRPQALSSKKLTT
ncbi:hypothetical protein R1flu_007033 [Riccia fluitans]|uniref:indole-3-pyruvate monooxygenase n=1 Tax=Riccia fluitans TaxID=41844 RepID=A0ABD1YXR2_9MARC